MNFRDTMKINDVGHLEIGGRDTVELAKEYGTPLYVMDESYIRRVIRAYKSAIESAYGHGNLAYASKAFSSMAIYSVMKSEGVNIDVVSGGEIYTALKAGFDIKNAYFHGNNKLISEIELAMDNGIGVIVVDNIEDISIIDAIANEKNIVQDVIIRTNPGVEAHTHSYIQTAKVDSKFGFSISNDDAMTAVKAAIAAKNIRLKGLHCHIGSQIFDKHAFVVAVDVMTDFIVEIKKELNYDIDELNMGGGFGVHYTDEDPRYTIEEYCNYVKIIVNALNDAIETKRIKKPYLMIEPGRSVVAEAGITLYTVGTVKDIRGIRKYINIDGGMGDNIRPALYEAKYEAINSTRANENPVEKVSIAGKCCESGDVIIKDVLMPKTVRGDIIAVFTTGAYGYSMASNYNRNPIPAVVLVNDGKSDIIVKRESYDDIIRNDVIPPRLK